MRRLFRSKLAGITAAFRTRLALYPPALRRPAEPVRARQPARVRRLLAPRVLALVGRALVGRALVGRALVGPVAARCRRLPPVVPQRRFPALPLTPSRFQRCLPVYRCCRVRCPPLSRRCRWACLRFLLGCRQCRWVRRRCRCRWVRLRFLLVCLRCRSRCRPFLLVPQFPWGPGALLPQPCRPWMRRRSLTQTELFRVKRRLQALRPPVLVLPVAYRPSRARSESWLTRRGDNSKSLLRKVAPGIRGDFRVNGGDLIYFLDEIDCRHFPGLLDLGVSSDEVGTVGSTCASAAHPRWVLEHRTDELNSYRQSLG
jgi:hypothetical protein